jgi:hypothetical protein
MKLDWELEFNLLVWNLNKIDLRANETAMKGAFEETRAVSLAEYCLKRIKETWTELLKEQAKETQAGGEGSTKEWTALLLDLAEDKQQSNEDGCSNEGQEELPRPPCRELVVTNESKLEKSIGLYFTGDGYMRRDLKWSIFFGHPNHGRIRFDNFVTNDVRWFIPIVTLTDEEQGKR